MKKEINLLSLALITFGITIAVIIVAFGFIKQQVDYDELTEVRIKKMGTMIPCGDEYAVILKNGTWFASHNEIEWFEDNVNEVVVDDAFVNDIKEILKENKAHKWDDFDIGYEIRKQTGAIMTDGENYSFYMHFSDGSITKIEEYNAYPRTFMTVLKEFEKEFEVLFGENK